MKIITIKELSEIINVKPKTIYQWAESGQIPCLKINRLVRFDMERISDWLKAREMGYNLNAQTADRPRKGGLK